LGVRENKVFLDTMEIPASRIGRTARLTTGTIVETVRMIDEDSELRFISNNLESAVLSLRGVAKQLGLGVVEIIASDPKALGVLGKAADLQARSIVKYRHW